MPIPGLSIVPADNNYNWKNALTTNSAINKPNSSTYSQSKPQYSNNTNKQLHNILSCITNTLTANQTPSPNANPKGTKACISNIFSSTESEKLNNFLFQYCLYFYANSTQFNIDIAKINFAMTYLTKVT